MIARQIEAAIARGPAARVVHSAGGGENTAAEAVKSLLRQGVGAEPLKAHFAVVQHSAWNWKNATEGAAQNIIAPHTIRIEDQNPFSGTGKTPAP